MTLLSSIVYTGEPRKNDGAETVVVSTKENA